MFEANIIAMSCAHVQRIKIPAIKIRFDISKEKLFELAKESAGKNKFFLKVEIDPYPNIIGGTTKPPRDGYMAYYWPGEKYPISLYSDGGAIGGILHTDVTFDD